MKDGGTDGFVSGRVTQIEVTLTDPTVPCVAATSNLGGRFDLQEMVPHGDGTYAEYYSVAEIDPDDLLEYAAAHEASDAQFIGQQGREALLEMVVTGDCPARRLAEHGALPRTVHATDGRLRIVAELPAPYDEGVVTERFFETYPDAELVSMCEKSEFTPLFSHRQLDEALEEHLTERQREVLELANRRGYYDWPREATQEELAAELDIATPTFTQHLRAAEQTLVRMVFDDGRRRTAPSAEHQP